MEQTVIAKLRYAHVPPRKMRLQADVIRGLSLVEAEAQLMLSPRRPGGVLLKLLQSAKANAKYKKMDPSMLFVKEIRVDQGPKQKRGMPRARGSMAVIEKKTSHITIVLGVSATLRKVPYLIHEHPKKKKIEKKSKKDSSEKKKPASEKKEEKMKQPSEPGAFKKVFRRKSI